MPQVSVIIPTYNRLNFLKNAVESVLNQTYREYEIIIVDDGSTDETYKHYRNSDPPVRCIHQAHSGVSAARNRGICEAKGSFVAFLDSDDYWLPNKLAEQSEFLQNHPDILLCQTEETWMRNGNRINLKKKHKKPFDDVFDKSLELCIISPSAVMMRKEFFDTVGLFDERLLVCEDYDLWLRASYRMKVPLIAEALTVKQAGHEDQLSQSLWGMDRFRVYALQKLLNELVSGEQRKKVKAEIGKKCSVLMNGAVKRHRYLFALKSALTKRFPARRWGLI